MNKLTKSQEKLNHLMCMDHIKLLIKNEKRTGNFYTGGKNIQSGYRNGIWQNDQTLR